MEGGSSLFSLVIVLVVAFLTPFILHRFRMNVIPVVVAEIIMGLIIGKSGFNIVQEDIWLETLSSLGFIFLMFLSGLEIDFSAFKGKNKPKSRAKKEPNHFVVATVVFCGIFAVSLGLSYLFVAAGFIENVFLMTLIISTVSLGVVVPTLKETNLMKTKIGQIILLVAVIADLATMILLAVFASLYDSGEGSTWLLLVLFAAGVVFYFLAKLYRNHKVVETMSSGTVQIGTRAVFTLIIVLVALSETVGAENILGAFLAGVLVSLLAPDQELIHKLDSFGYGFLIPIFFVKVGVELDIWALLSDKKMLLLIPLLLGALLISKVVPALILRIWFDRRTAVASGVLLTSTLSLVIAATAIGEKMGLLTPEMSGTLILVAILTCLITPVVFKKLIPPGAVQLEPVRVSFIGANQLTLSVSQVLEEPLYETAVYHKRQAKAETNISDSLFKIVELEELSIDCLRKTDIFSSDIVVVSTGNEEQNATLAIGMKEYHVDRVIARIESADLEETLREKNIEVFSDFRASKSLLRSLIESPNVVHLLTNQDQALYEIRLLNSRYEGMTLREFPFTGDVLFVRIFRGNDSIVPHGDTELLLHDRLIVTGSKKYAMELKRELEFGR